jgi:hypothetical protein
LENSFFFVFAFCFAFDLAIALFLDDLDVVCLAVAYFAAVVGFFSPTAFFATGFFEFFSFFGWGL